MPYRKKENPYYISENWFRKGCSICRQYNSKIGRQIDCRRCPNLYMRIYSLAFDYPYYKLYNILNHRG